MAKRRKQIKDMNIGFQDGFKGTGAVNDATLVATDTTMGVDTLSLPDAATVVPVGARFTTAGILTIRTVTASQNSQQWNLTNGGATAGTFTLTYNGDATAGIAFDATVSAVQSAIDALAGVIAGSTLTVSGTDGGPWIFTSGGTGANVATNTLTYDGSGLTGGPGVLSVVQDGTTTWEVDFSPALVTGSIPADDDVITWLPQRIVMRVGEGNFDWTETDEPIFDTDRDLIDSVRSGAEQPMDVNTSFVFDVLRASSGDPITPYEALHRIGNAAGWFNAAPEPCEPYCVEIFIEDIPPCSSEEAEVYTFPRFYKTSVNPDVRGGLVNVTGRCAATRPDIQRLPIATVLGQ